VNIGSGDSVGFNPAAMMTSIAMGSVVANNMAGTMKDAMQGVNPYANGNTPPPVPETIYNIAVNGQSTGPYNLTTLAQMAQSGQLNGDTLVWKPGMQNWVKLSSVNELKDVFNSVPPVPPKQD